MNWSTKVEDGLGILHMRTQTDDEMVFRNAITPRKGFKLTLRELSPVEFEIACVPTGEAEEDAPATPTNLSPEDMEVVAAQAGVEIEEGDRAVDIAHKVRAAKKRTS